MKSFKRNKARKLSEVNIQLPKININSKRKSYFQPLEFMSFKAKKFGSFIDNENNINNETNINKNENENTIEEIKINENKNKNKCNNYIKDIITNVNNKYNIQSKINTSLNNELKKEKIKENIYSYFISDFNRQNIKRKQNNKKQKISNNNSIIIFPRITKEKFEEIKQAKKNKLGQKEHFFTELIKEYKKDNTSNKKNKINIQNIDFQVKVSKKKALSILEDSGIIEAYDYLINNIKETGWPKKDLYEYSANIIKNYEKKWKKKKIQKTREEVEKHFEDKKKNFLQNLNKKNKNNKYNDMLFKILNERERNKFIKKLNKSRSSLYIMERNLSTNNFNKGNSNIKYKNININISQRNNSRNYKLNNNDITKNNSNYIRRNNNKQLKIKISLKNNKYNNYSTSNLYEKNLYKFYKDVLKEDKMEGNVINLKKILINKK